MLSNFRFYCFDNCITLPFRIKTTIKISPKTENWNWALTIKEKAPLDYICSVHPQHRSRQFKGQFSYGNRSYRGTDPSWKVAKYATPKLCHCGILVILSCMHLKNSKWAMLSLNSPLSSDLKTHLSKETQLSQIPYLGISSTRKIDSSQERKISSVQFSRSVMSNSLRPHDCSTPGLPVHHQLLEFTQTHVHWVGDAIQPSHPLSSPSPADPSPSQKEGYTQTNFVISPICSSKEPFIFAK